MPWIFVYRHHRGQRKSNVFLPSCKRNNLICRYDDLKETRWPEDTNADTRNREYRCNDFNIGMLTGSVDALAFSMLYHGVWRC